MLPWMSNDGLKPKGNDSLALTCSAPSRRQRHDQRDEDDVLTNGEQRLCGTIVNEQGMATWKQWRNECMATMLWPDGATQQKSCCSKNMHNILRVAQEIDE